MSETLDDIKQPLRQWLSDLQLIKLINEYLIVKHRDRETRAFWKERTQLLVEAEEVERLVDGIKSEGEADELTVRLEELVKIITRY